MLLDSLVAALVLAAVHVATPTLRGLDGTPRSIWLSLAGGISVAYVFVHVLPELGAAQAVLRESVPLPVDFLEHHVYLLSAAGLAAFYGLDRLAMRARRQRDARHGQMPAGLFWIHIASFGAYNVLIGYLLLHGEHQTLANLATFAFAMAVHFVVTDHALYLHHRSRYRRIGRWVLVAAALGGWALGARTAITEAGVALLFAFLAGGVILNVLKEELPEERESRFGAFVVGLVGYAALLLAL
jgi:hypothetical protein